MLVPGMGDPRSTYRFLAPALADAGYQAACADFAVTSDTGKPRPCLRPRPGRAVRAGP